MKRKRIQPSMVHPRSASGIFVAGALSVMVTACALSVVFTRHISRHHIQHLHELTQQRDLLQRQWSQLLVEHSSVSALEQVERKARQELGMIVPGPEHTAIAKN